jgi:hypothetical protein
VFREAIAPVLTGIKRSDLHIHDLWHFAGTQTARVGNLVETALRWSRHCPATDKQGRELAEAAEPHSELADTTV